jgi:amino acid adenylation domain-containing protein
VEDVARLAAWNDTSHPYPDEATVDALFDAQAAATPERTALVHGDERLTFSAVQRRADALAHLLIGKGVGPGVPVGVALSRSPDAIVAMLAIMKAGGAYLPLDPAYPDDRLSLMIEDAGVGLLLTGPGVDDLPATEVELIAVHGFDAGTYPVDPPARRAAPDDPLYVTFTSGSTGRPKGVLGTHRGMLNRFAWQWETYPFSAGEVCCQKTSFGFVDHLWETWGPLLRGHTLVILPDQVVQDGSRLVDALAEHRIERLVTVPSLMATLLRAVPDLGAKLARLRYLTLSGERLTRELADELHEALPDTVLLNLYGMSEGSADATWYDARWGAEGDSVPIGRPIHNMRVHVLDGDGRPVPIGQPGELHIGGVGLAAGYLGDPGLTAERFLPDPFVDDPAARMYRSGDLGRWRPDGLLEFLGRVDHQVKIHGIRIELGEIEAAARSLDEVGEAVVTAPEIGGDRRLVAYVMPAPGAAITPSAIRGALASVLPGYMVPTRIIVVDRFPLTPSGKIDRSALPDPIGGRLDSGAANAPPQASAVSDGTSSATRIEDTLVAMVCGLGWFDEGTVDRAANLADLGLDSLFLTQLGARIRQELGVRVTHAEILEGTPTIESLAKRIETETGPHAALPTFGNPAEPAPVSVSSDVISWELDHSQRDIWVASQLSDGGSASFNIATMLGLRGELDRAVLHEALRQVRQRHEALRTTFAPDGEHQIVSPDADIELPVLDLSDMAEELRAARLDAFLDADIATPYDLEAGPLFRATLVRLAGDDHVLVLSMHHLVGDGWSFDVIRRELGLIYAALQRGESPVLEEPTPYRAFVDWRLEQSKASAPYWWQLYEQLPSRLELPTNARPAVASFEYGFARATIDERLLTALRDVAAAEGVTLFTVMLTGWETLLHRLSGQDDFAHAVFVSGQPGMGVRSLVGYCTNALPMRARIDPAERLSAVLKRSRRAVVDALDNRYYSIAQLARALKLEGDPTRPPIVSTGMTMESVAQRIEFGDLESRGWDHGRRAYGPLDLELYLMESASDLTVDLQYAAPLLEPDTIEHWLGGFVHLLSQMAAGTDVRVADLRLPEAPRPAPGATAPGDGDEGLAAAELELLARWNDTAHPHPDDAVAHDLFDAQAAATPDATALIFEGEAVSFAQLQARANRLAHHLIERGVSRGDVVGIAIARSPEMVVAMLATIKAGGAYLPLDPALPAERLVGMIEDADVGLILTGPGVDDLPATGAELIAVHRFDGRAYPSTSPAQRSEPDDGFFVIFTSGSTGRPKGMLGTHRGMLNRFAWQWESYPFSAGEVCCQKTSFGFVDHLWETWGPLLRGHALVLVPDAVVQDGGRFIELLAEHAIERLVTVPSFFRTLLHGFPDLGQKLSRLRYLTLSGERLTKELAADVRAALPDTVLLNLYGMSEGSGDATWYDDRWGAEGDSVPIGRPIHNMRVHVLDEHRRRVPIGAVGELHLAGVGLAAGYLGNPGLTAERFLPDPFDDRPGARMYRSGDLGRWRPDGMLEYVGRVDDQVKIRGIRVEPGEVEAAARSLEEVEDAVVTARTIGLDLLLVAYLTCPAGAQASPTALRIALARTLPDHLVPARIIILERFPLNPNGKVDRDALPDPATVQPVSDEPYVAPRTALEARLAAIWVELLGVERVGVHDNFFDLGGDSLSAIRGVMAANRAGLRLAPIDAFRYQTIVELAAAAALDRPEALAGAQELVTGPTPLTPAQLRFLEERDTPDVHHWNLATLLAAEHLSPTALATAVEALVRHHDALRLRLWQEDGRWRQETAGLPAAIPFESRDLSMLSTDEQAAEIERVCTAMQGGLELGAGLLLRVVHFDRGPAASDRLFVAVHHFAVDGMTWPVLMEDLGSAYRQALAGEPVALPPKTTSIKAWATALERSAQAPAVVDAADEWMGLPWHEVAALPTDHPADRSLNTNDSAATVEHDFSPSETSALLGGWDRPEQVILAAVARALSAWTASRTVLVDVLDHGRGIALDGVNLSRTVGFTLSYDPLLVSHPTWEDSLAAVAAVAAQGQRGPAGYTFELLRFKSPDREIRRRLTALARADVLFNYEGTSAPRADGAPWTDAPEPFGPTESPRMRRQYPLAVRALLDPDLRITFVYSRALHRRQTIESVAAEVAATVRQLLGASLR